MSIFHEVEPPDVLNRRKQRLLGAKLRYLEDTPSWFERRLMEDTGLTEDELDQCEAPEPNGPTIIDEKLEKLELFIRRWEAGAITATAGEMVIAPESPYASKAEVAKIRKITTTHEKPEQPTQTSNDNHMNAAQLLKRYERIEKPYGFAGKFCKHAGFNASTLTAIRQGKASDKSLEAFKAAIEDAEAGKIGGKVNNKPIVRPKPISPPVSAAPAARDGMVSIPRELLPSVLTVLKEKLDALKAQISALEELS